MIQEFLKTNLTESGNFPPFMQPEFYLPFWEEHAAGSYPEPDESNPHFETLLQ
jgi:hypothetical protein